MATTNPLANYTTERLERLFEATIAHIERERERITSRGDTPEGNRAFEALRTEASIYGAELDRRERESEVIA